MEGREITEEWSDKLSTKWRIRRNLTSKDHRKPRMQVQRDFDYLLLYSHFVGICSRKIYWSLQPPFLEGTKLFLDPRKTSNTVTEWWSAAQWFPTSKQTNLSRMTIFLSVNNNNNSSSSGSKGWECILDIQISNISSSSIILYILLYIL